MVQKEEIKKWLETIGQIRVKNKIYWKHPVYDVYAADLDGNVINISRKVPMKGNKMYNGYRLVAVRGSGQKNWKTYLVHRFVYECIFGLIPDGMVIDHLDNDKENNSLINLQVVSQQENSKRGVNNRDNSYMKSGWNKRRLVKAINIKTEQTFYFDSMSSAKKQLGINVGTISRCCHKIGYHKTGISKEDGQRYKFEFTTKLKITKC